MTAAFVTNFCPHYRVRTFELLSQRLEMEFLFFSRGKEWYWPDSFGVSQGDFPHRDLGGFTVSGTRIVPSLLPRLLLGSYEAVIQGISGRFALPVTFLACRLTRTPFILWTGVWHRLGTPVHRWLHPLTRYIYQHADAVVVYGEHVRRFLLDEGVSSRRIFLAPHATDAELYGRPVTPEETKAVRRRLDLPMDQPVILYLGRLEAVKGVHDLLEAFLSLGETEPARLLFVGEGRERESLSARVREAGAEDRVHLSPPIPPEKVPVYHALASVLVLPSITTRAFKEPWGLVVNEAFHQGTPVIASDAVGAAAGGLAEDEVTGLVVPEGNREALAGALERLLDDEPLRRSLGETARSRVAEWTNERMVQGFVDAVASTRSPRKIFRSAEDPRKTS